MSESCLLSGRKKLPCRAVTPAMNYGVHLTLMFWRGNRNNKRLRLRYLGEGQGDSVFCWLDWYFSVASNIVFRHYCSVLHLSK
jgi:hypothetical protein